MTELPPFLKWAGGKRWLVPRIAHLLATPHDRYLEPTSVRCIPIQQPLGTFFVASIPADLLVQITSADVRRMTGERPFETYLGIQRPLSKDRVVEIGKYVNTQDACFPTAVLLAVDAKCAEYDEKKSELTLKNYIPDVETAEDKPIWRIQIAQVLDGQHRIEGLKSFTGQKFDVNVSVFIDADIEDQAYLFSTVNLTQTKVNKSLVYDLFDLAKTRSPQKTCHNIAVALDQNPGSPFHKKIKRLGHATPGRSGETFTQATIVQGILQYMSKDVIVDRDLYLKGRRPAKVREEVERELIFRNMFVDERDLEIFDVLWNFFTAVMNRWPAAWSAGGTGMILNKTNGYRGLMRLLRPAYLHLVGPGEVPSIEQFKELLGRSSLEDDDFNVERFPPGTSGEALLFRTLLADLKLREM
jgi:DGQHR domain-containing protein